MIQSYDSASEKRHFIVELSMPVWRMMHDDNASAFLLSRDSEASHVTLICHQLVLVFFGNLKFILTSHHHHHHLDKYVAHMGKKVKITTSFFS